MAIATVSLARTGITVSPRPGKKNTNAEMRVNIAATNAIVGADKVLR